MQGFKLKQIETFLNLHHPDRKQIYCHLKKPKEVLNNNSLDCSLPFKLFIF